MAVDSEVYRPPDNYRSLSNINNAKNLREELQPSYYTYNTRDLPQIALAMGFILQSDVPTKQGAWEIFDRPNFGVPNFTLPDTMMNSTLALYSRDGGIRQAVLRTSEEPYPVEDFEKDLNALTRHYVERPRIWGFPSRELSRPRSLFTALVTGSIIGDGIGYYLSGQPINMGLIIGEVVGPLSGLGLSHFAELHARNQISQPQHYTGGGSALTVLENERNHTIRVDLWRELYSALGGIGLEFTPNQFLMTINRRLPQPLYRQRFNELQKMRYPNESEETKQRENSLPKLVRAVEILLAKDKLDLEAEQALRALEDNYGAKELLLNGVLNELVGQQA